MEAMLAGGDWLLGQFCLADISIGPYLERIEANGLDRLADYSARPRLGAWWQRMQARAGVIEAFAYPNPDA